MKGKDKSKSLKRRLLLVAEQRMPSGLMRLFRAPANPW
jgi:hypothetical protein